MSTMFKIRALQALTIANRRILSGTEIELDAQTASELIRAGRARLVDAEDLGPLMDATSPRRNGWAQPLVR